VHDWREHVVVVNLVALFGRMVIWRYCGFYAEFSEMAREMGSGWENEREHSNLASNANDDENGLIL
jgi:hypothetical protein